MTVFNKLPAKPVLLDTAARARLTLTCRDTDAIPKHEAAGQIVHSKAGPAAQVMHNGLLVEYGGYYGDWMAEIISGLRGHHEPQEEWVFWHIVQRLPEQPTTIELGAFWAYYSLWVKRERPEARCHLFEPDTGHLELARRNFALNGYDAYFERAAAGLDGATSFYSETEADNVVMRSKSVDTICAEQGINSLDLLHLDVQGSELAALHGATETVRAGKLRFLFVSTHHHLISGDPLTHQRCLHWVRQSGAHIICEHSIYESFSGDGLIAASYDPQDRDLVVDVSIARASQNLFRELEYDLAELQNRTA